MHLRINDLYSVFYKAHIHAVHLPPAGKDGFTAQGTETSSSSGLGNPPWKGERSVCLSHTYIALHTVGMKINFLVK